MAGPIQTAIGRALGAVEATIAVGKKLYEDRDEGQTDKTGTSKVENKEEAKKDSKEDKSASKAVKSAQDSKIDSPRKVFFDETGEALATSNEMATILSQVSLSNALASSQRSRNNFEARKMALYKKRNIARKK